MTTEIEQRLAAIEQRNARVEGEKAWETSWLRRLLIMALTYAVVVAYGSVIEVSSPFLAAVVPTVGFLLSTLTFSAVKGWWLGRRGVRRPG